MLSPLNGFIVVGTLNAASAPASTSVSCCFFLLYQSSDRLKECQKRSTVARNEYLLSLSGTNAHLNKFYSEDLMELMKVCT